MNGRSFLLAGCVLAVAIAAQEPSPLEGLVTIAKARAERQRPVQQKALEPFLNDLSLEYKLNQELLDRRIPEAAALGDGIVPLLLEHMTPKEDSQAARYLAANSARVLKLIDPAGFVEALVEIAGGKSETGRLWSLWLLGATRSTAAAQAITQLLPNLKGRDLVQAIESLGALAYAPAAPQLAAFVLHPDKRLREAAIGYLTAVRQPDAVAEVVKALPVENDPDLVALHIGYLELTARENAAAATAILPLLSADRFDREQLTAICRALATIAPKNHPATLKALKTIVERQEIGALGRAAALTMRELGDKSGVKTLLENLQRHVNDRRRDSVAYEMRGEAYLMIGKYDEAVHDLKEAIRFTNSSSYASTLWLQIARCEARRERWPAVKTAFVESRANLETLTREIARQPELQRAMESETVRRYVESLKR